MKNSKVIVLNGFSRGGTNIVWNILQSHPQVCGPLLETGELLYRRQFRFLPRRLVRKLLSHGPFLRSPLAAPVLSGIDRLFYDWKLKNHGHPEFGTRYDGQPYQFQQVADAVLCLKSTDSDLELTDCFRRMYPEAYFVGLIRDGYALCNGRVRRGRKASETGEQYRWLCERMLEYSRTLDRYLLIRFEDVVANPFAVARRLYEFCELDPVALPKLRLKSKRVLGADRSHATRFGELNRHYWFDRRSIGQLLDAAIDQRQHAALDPRDRQEFEDAARPILEYFGYSAAPIGSRRAA
ncbi:MAG: sulfotransferase [Pirellulaceae bacterium]|nr:sulfotransferase [Pirellulaceae bacterium]